MVTDTGTNWTRCRVTVLIDISMLSLSQTDTFVLNAPMLMRIQNKPASSETLIITKVSKK